MTDPESLLMTIDEYLISIAEGIHAAQTELEQTAVHGLSYSYYLPKLDFELKMTIELEDRQVSAGAARPKLLMRPATAAGQTSSGHAISTVRGSFVAVPVAAAKALRAGSSIVWKGREGTVTVEVYDGAGTPQPGLEVHFNIDRDLSRNLTADRLKKDIDFTAETAFFDAVVPTDSSGKASSPIRLSPQLPSGAVVAIVLDAAGQTETVIYQIPEGGQQ
jgi:hypothetical protein